VHAAITTTVSMSKWSECWDDQRINTTWNSLPLVF